MHTPVNPSFTILKWGLRGSKLYRYVFVMERGLYSDICVCNINEPAHDKTYKRLIDSALRGTDKPCRISSVLKGRHICNFLVSQLDTKALPK